MRNVIKAQFGLSEADVRILAKRFRRYGSDCGWQSLEKFLEWCSISGYRAELRLRRWDSSKPHGPVNSYFHDRAADIERKRALAEERKAHISPLCKGCELECPVPDSRCKVWMQRFVDNWNNNIHRRPIHPMDPSTKPVEVRNYFRYEHPDLAREGILWTG